MTYIFRDSLGIQVVSMLNRNMKLLYLKFLNGHFRTAIHFKANWYVNWVTKAIFIEYYSLKRQIILVTEYVKEALAYLYVNLQNSE